MAPDMERPFEYWVKQVSSDGSEMAVKVAYGPAAMSEPVAETVTTSLLQSNKDNKPERT
jgi:hypothetical protein